MEDFQTLTASVTGIQLNENQMHQFEKYRDLLLEYNQQVNLTAIIEPRAILEKHFVDSLACSLAFHPQPATVVDIGSGAGFPGLPLAIAFPHLQVTLIESIQKKANFCQYVVDGLRLRNVIVIAKRAETVGQIKKYHHNFDIAVVRAVTKLPQLIEYAQPLVKKEGMLVAMKGKQWERETADIDKRHEVIPYMLPSDHHPRVLIQVYLG